MSWKKQKIAMPTTMAGIIGLSPTTEIGGIKIKPHHFIYAVLAFIISLKLLSLIIG